jgi:hypothetical protein
MNGSCCNHETKQARVAHFDSCRARHLAGWQALSARLIRANLTMDEWAQAGKRAEAKLFASNGV